MQVFNFTKISALCAATCISSLHAFIIWKLELIWLKHDRYQISGCTICLINTKWKPKWTNISNFAVFHINMMLKKNLFGGKVYICAFCICMCTFIVSEWMMVNDFISVAIQSPQSAQKKRARFKSLYRVKCHQMQWRPNVHLSEMQSKTMQCTLDSLITVFILTLLDVFLLNIRKYFLWSVCSMAGQGVIKVFGHCKMYFFEF